MKSHELLKKYIIGLSQGLSTSLIAVSKAGQGKTETTLKTLQELNYKNGVHYLYFNNYLTPVELYKILQGVNGLQNPKILVLDDIEDTLRNPKVTGLFKGALAEVEGKRKVMWHSASYLITDKEFEFHGRIIFLLNEYNRKNPVFNAVADRALYYEFDLPQDEIFDLMKERAKIPYQNISYEKRQEIIEYLLKVADKKSNISLRLLPKAFNLFILSPNHYKELVKELL